MRNSNWFGPTETEFFFGMGGDIPLAGDWDGDGYDTFAVWHPSRGAVYISNGLGTAPADFSYFFGEPRDRPFSGDFDGDGKDTVGLYCPGTGLVYRQPDAAGRYPPIPDGAGELAAGCPDISAEHPLAETGLCSTYQVPA